MRYEDLVEAPQKTLEDCMKFLLEIEDIEDTNIQRRIAESLKDKASSQASYSVQTIKAVKNLEVFTEEEKKRVFAEAREKFEFLEYDKLKDFEQYAE